MYTKGILQRFADDLEQKGRTVDAEDFRSAIGRIQFETSGRFQICVGTAVGDALQGTSIELLSHELDARVSEFLTAEDQEAARGVFEMESLISEG